MLNTIKVTESYSNGYCDGENTHAKLLVINQDLYHFDITEEFAKTAGNKYNPNNKTCKFYQIGEKHQLDDEEIQIAIEIYINQYL